jgi:hypothetical protein
MSLRAFKKKLDVSLPWKTYVVSGIRAPAYLIPEDIDFVRFPRTRQRYSVVQKMICFF